MRANELRDKFPSLILTSILGRPKAISRCAPHGSQGAFQVMRFHCVRVVDRCLSPSGCIKLARV